MNIAFAEDYSGDYICDGLDSQDGQYKPLIQLKLNRDYPKKDNYATYDFHMKVPGYPYEWSGIAAADKKHVAVFFEAIGENAELSDRGVGIATFSTKKTGKKYKEMSFKKFYYEKAYKGKPSFGFENCIKNEVSKKE